MYRRIVVKHKINDYGNIIDVGEHLMHDSNLSPYWLSMHSDSIVEIPMDDDEWLEYISDLLRKSYEKALKLQIICEQLGLEVELPIGFESRTADLQIIGRGERPLDPSVYGASFSALIDKAVWYKNDVDAYEKRVFSKIGNSKTL